MRKSVINLAPLIDVLFIILLVMLGKQSEEVEKEKKIDQQERRQLAQTKETLEEQVIRMRREMERMQAAAEKYEQKIREQETMVQDWQFKHSSILSLLELTKTELAKEKETVKSLELRQQDLEKLIHDNQKQKDELDQEKEKLKQQLMNLLSDIEKLKHDIEQYKNDIDKIEKEKSRLSQEIQKIEKEKKDIIEKNQQIIRQQKESLETEIESKKNIEKQMKNMWERLDGPNYHRTYLSSEILLNNFNIYQVILMESMDKRVKIVVKSREDRVLGEQVIKSEEELPDFFRKALPSSVFIESRQSQTHIFLVFWESTIIKQYLSWVEKELQKMNVIYGTHQLPK